MRPLHAIVAIVGLGLAGLVAALGLMSFPDGGPTVRYPEFETVSAAQRERALAAMPPKFDPGDHKTYPDVSGYDPDVALAGLSPLAVLAVMHEREGGPSWLNLTGPCFDDDRRIPLGDWLARHADDSLTEVFLRLVMDEQVGFGLRDAASVALCREGNEAALAPLVSFVADTDRPERLRERILQRLPRIGSPLGPKVEALLSFPFHGLDDIAAGALAVAGEPIAPSLIRDALADGSWSLGGREHLLVRAVLAIAGSDREIAAQGRLALDLLQAKVRGGSPPYPPPPDEALAALVPLFTQWLEAHPEARTSRFERERAAYRTGDRFRREQRTLQAAEPWTLPDDDFDLAAALVRVDPKVPERRERWLDALDRMAGFLRREIGDRTDPDEVLGILHRRVLSDDLTAPGPLPDLFGPPSYLERVLHYRSGNCLGWTSVYLALADRLSLPLVPVATPNHVFVRWDDGETIVDVELTALGMRRAIGTTGREAPRVIPRREVVASLFINRSFTWRTDGRVKDEDRFEKSLLYADRAVAWAPASLDAHAARVQAFMALDNPAGAARAAKDAIAASEIDAAAVAGLLTAGDVLLSAGDAAAALGWFDRARKLAPDDGEILRRRMFCLEMLDRDGDLIREGTTFLADRDHRGVRLLRLGAMARQGDERWRTELGEVEGEGTARWLLRMSLASTLLGRGLAEDALEVLGGLDDLDAAARAAKGRRPFDGGRTPSNADMQQFVNDTVLLEHWRRSVRLRGRALDQAGRGEEATRLLETLKK